MKLNNYVINNALEAAFSRFAKEGLVVSTDTLEDLKWKGTSQGIIDRISVKHYSAVCDVTFEYDGSFNIEYYDFSGGSWYVK